MRHVRGVLFVGLSLAAASAARAEEPLRYATGLVRPADADYGVPYLSWDAAELGDLPERLDLRENGMVSPVKNQGQCGSCWAFAGMAVVESAELRENGRLLDLSEQEIVSCDSSAYGCSGGWQPFDYVVDHGVGAEADFPYAARDARCKQITPVAHGDQWANVGQSGRRATVDEVRKAVVDHGALWVTVAADGWNNPGPILRNCGGGQINHAVTIVGYEPDGKGGYNFIVKNSWGSTWNGDGYVKAPLGCDSLGADASFYIPKDASACTPPAFGLGKKVVIPGGGEVRVASTLDKSGAYEWYRDGELVSFGAPLKVAAGASGDYVVRTRTDCGRWEMKVRVEAN
jgi:C1A family cysteine protease